MYFLINQIFLNDVRICSFFNERFKYLKTIKLEWLSNAMPGSDNI